MKLNSNQELAVMSDNQRIVNIAAAGSGKTRCMISRISRIVDDLHVPSHTILALTFTNAAAFEMRNRYRAIHEGEESPTFCTFHSFCYNIIGADVSVRNRLGYFRGIPKVADDNKIKRITSICKQKLGISLSDTKLNGTEHINKKDEFQKKLFIKQFNKMMRDENLITFDMMCKCICKLFIDDDPMITHYKDRYSYIFVDEFQDTDEIQWSFVKSFMNHDVSIYVTGDVKQNLYSFRGTDSSIMKSLVESDEWQTIKLDHNYRSTKQICDFANTIHEAWGDSEYNLQAISDVSGDEVNHRLGIDFEADLNSISEDIKNYNSVAVLCRTNREVDKVMSELTKHNIPCRTKSSENESSFIIKAAIDTNYLVDWLSVKLSSDEYNEYIRYCLTDNRYRTEDGFIELYESKFPTYIACVKYIRSILNSGSTDTEKIDKICEFLKLSNPDNCRTIKAFINYTSIIKEHSDGVYVGTIHSVKGLEYDCVHLVGVNGRYFKINTEDNMNVYYVGCTRAKQKLVVYDSSIRG